MASERKLHVVPVSARQPAPDMSYEYEQRRKSASKDWAAIHIAADRRPPLPFFGRLMRTWR